MSYLYNQKNLLDSPEKYMYTRYQGDALFLSYFKNRNKVLRRCRENISQSSSLFVRKAYKIIKNNIDNNYALALKSLCPPAKIIDRENFNSENNDNKELIEMNKLMSNISIDRPVKTAKLLTGLFSSMVINPHNNINKIWLDHLVQRFEVTKKIYVEYQPGFRKGLGSNNSIELYWLFALDLSIYYVQTNKIKYLSTMLKVCDLITSLPFKDISQDIPQCGLDLILSSEVIFVQILLKTGGIEYEHE
jgi:hypothetical protein